MKLLIRQRQNARCHRTEHRADSARGLTRLIATGLYGGVNALADRVALQEHRSRGRGGPGRASVQWGAALDLGQQPGVA